MLALEKSLEIINESFDLELARINRDYNYMTRMAEINGMEVTCMFESGEGSDKNILQRMVDAIVKFIQDVTQSIQSAFAKDRMDDVDTFLNSQTGQMQLSYDYAAIEDVVDKKMLEGRKLVQKISSATGVSDATIAKFADSCSDAALRFGPTLIEIGAVNAVRKRVVNSKLFSNIDKAFQFLCHADPNVPLDAQDTEKYTYAARKYKEDEPKREAEMKKQMDHMMKVQQKKFAADEKKKKKMDASMNKAAAKKASSIINGGKQEQQKKKVIDALGTLCTKAQKARQTVFQETSAFMHNAKAKMSRKNK